MTRTRKKKVSKIAPGYYNEHLKNLSDVNPSDLDEYLGPVWKKETFKQKKTAILPPSGETLPILNTIGKLNFYKVGTKKWTPFLKNSPPFRQFSKAISKFFEIKSQK